MILSALKLALLAACVFAQDLSDESPVAIEESGNWNLYNPEISGNDQGSLHYKIRLEKGAADDGQQKEMKDEQQKINDEQQEQQEQVKEQEPPRKMPMRRDPPRKTLQFREPPVKRLPQRKVSLYANEEAIIPAAIDSYSNVNSDVVKIQEPKVDKILVANEEPIVAPVIPEQRVKVERVARKKPIVIPIRVNTHVNWPEGGIQNPVVAVADSPQYVSRIAYDAYGQIVRLSQPSYVYEYAPIRSVTRVKQISQPVIIQPSWYSSANLENIEPAEVAGAVQGVPLYAGSRRLDSWSRLRSPSRISNNRSMRPMARGTKS